jgi:hypothetical protein
MSDEETTSDDVRPLKGIAFVAVMILACAFANDSRFTTSGHYKNRLNPAQRIEFKSGSYFSGTARVICYQTTRPIWVSQDDETVRYSRTGNEVTLSGTTGNAVFAISNTSLTDPEGVIWDKEFSGD